MKQLFVFCLFASIIYGKDTITFPTYEQNSYPKTAYSYNYDSYRYKGREWDYKEYDRDDKNYYTKPSIPEPSTYALFAGLLGLGFAIIRKRKK